MIFQWGEIFVFSRDDSESHDDLDIYLFDQNAGNGKIMV